MKRNLCGFLIVMMLVATPSVASLTVDVDGVRFDKTVNAMDQRLHLHGAGLLKVMVFIKAYAGALYLPESVPSENVLKPVAKQLVLEYFHPIKGEDFARATRKKIADNATADQVNGIQSRIDNLAAMYRDVKPGDRYALTYIPDRGTTLSLNGEALGSIPGDDFARAVFAIWLGANPIDQKFRDQLLRGS
ncbi:chalcone isomerase family protein [Desulfosarcina sp.]|uniref:chalcone isomerase family protein n=1 Tax=Desulfosarcina sp. TaxID=2027861 RepID=UPI003970B648